MDERLGNRLNSTLHSAPWFISSVIITAVVCLMYHSGRSISLPLIGESLASLPPGKMSTPIWTLLIYLVARAALPKWILKNQTVSAAISGGGSFLLLAIVYDQYIVLCLSDLLGRTELEQDTWAIYYLAMIAFTFLAMAIKCCFVQIALASGNRRRSSSPA